MSPADTRTHSAQEVEIVKTAEANHHHPQNAFESTMAEDDINPKEAHQPKDYATDRIAEIRTLYDYKKNKGMGRAVLKPLAKLDR